MKCATTGGVPGMTDTTAGITYICPVGGGACIPAAATAINILYADLYFNDDVFLNWGTPLRTHVFAHEIGHSLGLAHHSGPVLMRATASASYLGPTATDIGPTPPCSGGGKGIRCIYNWP